MKMVAISDTHGLHRQIIIPSCDVLVCSGDITSKGNISEAQDFNNWLGSLPCKYKVVVAGNHDFCFEKYDGSNILKNAIYLQDSEVVIDGIKFYGSPWQPVFFNWAFNLPRGKPLQDKWAKIPNDTNILITHGPPARHGDVTMSKHKVGCHDLLDRIKIVKPAFHIFGHIHEGRGTSSQGSTKCINASSVDFRYNVFGKPIETDINR